MDQPNNQTDCQSKKAASEILKENVPLIMGKWMAVIRERVDSAKFQPELILRDSFHSLVVKIADNLDIKNPWPDSRRSDAFSSVCRNHGQSRALIKEYELDDIVEEYRLLRILVFDFFDVNSGLNKEERTRFLESVDVGISFAAYEFSQVRSHFPEQISVLSTKNKEIQDQIMRLEEERKGKDIFILSISHDVRTPITSAKTCAELILVKTKDSTEVHTMCQNFARRIILDLTRSDRMIKDLLDSSRLTSGEKLGIKIEKTPFSPVELINKTIQNLILTYGNVFEFTPSKSCEEIKVYWGYDDMTRVLENLFINAVKHGTNQRPVKINLFRTETKELSLTVSNECQQLNEKDLSEIFNLFKTKNLNKPGWGIGLTLVKGLVESHGGNVSVQSNQYGITFIVILPEDSRHFC